MKNLIYFFALTLFFTSCKEQPKSPEDIINKSIDFHDQHNQWKNLNAQFIFDSRFSIATFPQETLNISMNIKTEEFIYHNPKRKIKVSYVNDICSADSCTGACKGYIWTKSFYPYVWGLPMKLKDPGYSPEKEWGKDEFNGFDCYTVNMHYDNENFTFYFDQSDYQLRGFKFIKNNTEKHGEIVKLKGLHIYEGIKFPAYRTWLNLDSTLIGTNQVLEINKL